MKLLLDILLKRRIEKRRNKIARNAKKSTKEYHSGKYIPLSSDEEIVNHLNSL